jgi:hypothetical protein
VLSQFEVERQPWSLDLSVEDLDIFSKVTDLHPKE